MFCRSPQKELVNRAFTECKHVLHRHVSGYKMVSLNSILDREMPRIALVDLPYYEALSPREMDSHNSGGFAALFRAGL